MEAWIKIKMDNAAFEDNESRETARILMDLAIRLQGHQHLSAGHDQALRDLNGNEVGFLGVYDEQKCLTNATDETAD